MRTLPDFIAHRMTSIDRRRSLIVAPAEQYVYRKQATDISSSVGAAYSRVNCRSAGARSLATLLL